MRIFLIIAHFYPQQTPRAYRWTQIAKQWHKEGHEVTVLTLPVKEEGAAAGLNGIAIYNTPKTHFTTPFDSIIERKNKGDNRITRWIKYLYRSNGQYLIWPDRYRFWIRPAKRQARNIIGIENPDVLITVSKPFSTHLIGYAMKKEFPSLIWCMDIGDPFRIADPFNATSNVLLDRLQRKEADVLHAADWVFVTNEGLRSAYIAYTSEWANKVRTASHFTQLSACKQKAFQKDKIYHFVYTGRFYPGVRDAFDFIDFTLELNNYFQKNGHEMAIHFYGPIDIDIRRDITRQISQKYNLYFHPEIKRKDIPTELPENSLLVNIGNRSSVQIPSKVVDYLALGLPILHYYYEDDDPTNMFLQSHAQLPVWQIKHGQYAIENWHPFLSKIEQSGGVPSQKYASTVSEISQKYLDIIVD